MRIALINESSQASKNKIIMKTLEKVAIPRGHEVFNYGMNEDDPDYSINYIEAGILTGILLNSGVIDFVITGCGTGEGVCMAANMMSNVYCGYIKESTDAFLFTQINSGNAVSLPFSKDFGWCSELNLEYIFKSIFETEHGNGYPADRANVQEKFRKFFTSVKQSIQPDYYDQIKLLDVDIKKNILSSTICREHLLKELKDDFLKVLLKGIG